MQEVQATCRRNGAFQCRLDESLDQPGLFHLEYLVSTWAEHLRQNMRMTVDETKVFNIAWNLHVRRLGTDRAPFPFNPEIHASARLWLLRSHLCGHIELVEPEFDSYQILLRLVTDFTVGMTPSCTISFS